MNRNVISPEVVSTPYTEVEMESAFSMVKNHTDWRSRIDCHVPLSSNIGLIVAVIIHYTATVPVITRRLKYFTVKADGYNLGPKAT